MGWAEITGCADALVRANPGKQSGARAQEEEEASRSGPTHAHASITYDHNDHIGHTLSYNIHSYMT